ncbi:MAG: hypothetical protein INR73_08155 [Williamsia sp.]|nr:hypothetical protein [Williamsia sp.]
MNKRDLYHDAFKQLSPIEEKGKSFATEIPGISLPKGGGAIKSIDEKFQVNAVNGTAGFSIPFPFSPSRNAFMPSLALSYNSGSGNDVFGLGWNAEPTCISRKTENKLPEYNDAHESDTFIFSGAEDLVPALINTDGNWIKDQSLDGSIKRYKPRIEGGFARIEKITEVAGNVYWKVTSRDNVVSIFGRSRSAQIFNPDDETRIYKWLLEFSYDDKGNCFQFEYKGEDKVNIASTLHEKNRLNGFSAFTNVYLKRIKYCNKESYLINSNPQYLLELVLDYGEHDSANPQPGDDNGWPCRKDAFSDYRAGFEIRTYRLCRRILMFHHFPELGVQPCLVRSIGFEYNAGAAFTFLASVTQKSYVRKENGSYSQKSLPPFEFNYEPLGWNTQVQSLSKENLENLPVGMDDRSYQWIDLYGEGLSGMLTEQATGWYYKRNLGEGTFEPTSLVSPKPSFTGIGTGAMHFQDIEANGQKQLVSDHLNGFYEFSPEEGWLPFRNYKEVANIDLRNPNVKLIDLNGDGKADILISEDDIFTWHVSKGKEGFESYRTARKTGDEEKGPAIVFADSTGSIVLADMSGDGLTDIVRIRNNDIAYWPNLGYGRFGAKITMSNAPKFDHPDCFNPQYLKLADLDGSGTTDIIYLGKDAFNIYFNQSGNNWSEANVINGTNPVPFPNIDDLTNVNVVDLLGNGTGCIIWSSPLPKHAANPLRYIDLMGGKKPHVMVDYKNNLGKEVSIEYKPSIFFYLKDKQEGKPWITKLPFPVQCVSRTVVRDTWRRSEFSNRYFYHHGFYDYADREFRGFGRVDQVDAETFGVFAAGNAANPYTTDDLTLYQPPVMTKTWFHTGAVLNKEKVLTQFGHEYFAPVSESFREKGLPEPDLEGFGLNMTEYKEALRSCKGTMLRQEVFELDVEEVAMGNYKPVKYFSSAHHNCHIQLLQPQQENAHAVFLTTESEAITYNYELDLSAIEIVPDPRIAHTLNLQTDETGNVLQAIEIVYPRIGRHADAALPAGAEDLVAQVQKGSHVKYTVNAYTNDVIDENNYRLRLLFEIKTYELAGISPASGLYFSLEELRTVTSGIIAEIPYHILPTTAALHKRMVECVRILYFKPDLQTPEILGVINRLGLLYETYKLALTESLLDAVFSAERLAVEVRADLANPQKSGYLNGSVLTGFFPLEDTTGQYWQRSGVAGFAGDAAGHFFLPEKYTDPFDNITTLQFDEYDLYIKSSVDAVGNQTGVMAFDFRVLAPSKMKDINNNESEVLYDLLGMPAAMVLKGKGDEGDHLTGVRAEIGTEALVDFFTAETYEEAQARAMLGNATARYVYYLGERGEEGNISYNNHPACAAVIKREKHAAQLAVDGVSPVQIAFQYSDGSGVVITAKMQAEPATEEGSIRWIANGKTILNNKGKPVKQYEPYFTDNHFFEEPVERGVTPVMYYDAAGRLVRTEAPDGSYSRVEFTPWFSRYYDQNDTVLEPGNSWYERMSNSANAATREAAQKAAIHADTPVQIFLDSLGRDTISIAHNKWKRGNPLEGETIWVEKYLTYTKLDPEGKPLWIQDARGNRVMQYIFPYKPDGTAEAAWSGSYSPCYDMAGNLLFQHSMDAGDSWMMTDAAGKPFYSWDRNERHAEGDIFITEHRMYHAEYDSLHRPTKLWLKINDENAALIDKRIYGDDATIPGESLPDPQARNLRGQAYQHYDSGGLVTNTRFDFKGNLLEAQKRWAAALKEPVIDWQDGSATNMLEPETFSQQTAYDALNRMTRQYNWHKSNNNVAVYEPQYNRRGLLEAEDFIIKATKNESGYDEGQRTTAVSKITYDAKGQLQRIYYGNGTSTRHLYDEKTFRLVQLRTTRNGFDAGLPVQPGLKDTRVLQNLYYSYDAVGNITEIYDDAYEPAFFNNQRVEPRSRYMYDALYHLIQASGRENSAFNSTPERKGANAAQTAIPVTEHVLRNYLQQYDYDAAGNITRMKHWGGKSALAERWTRDYRYGDHSNRLLKTWTGGDETTAITYHCDTHGSMRNLENTGEEQYMRWNYNDMLQALNLHGGGWAYYQYDSSKERNRKQIERLDGSKEERQYLGGMEWYRRINAAGNVLEEIETHHLFAGNQRVLMVEDVIRTDNADLNTGVLYRYQYNNHLGSASLEMDEGAGIVSYEEYHPYGTTAYEAFDKAINPIAKRYRYTGMEREEESGLAYHSARFYLPWLGRWLSADPIGIEGQINQYDYVNNNPILKFDLTGMDAVSSAGTLENEKVKKVNADAARFLRKVEAGTPFQPRVCSTSDVGSNFDLSSINPTLPKPATWDKPSTDEIPIEDVPGTKQYAKKHPDPVGEAGVKGAITIGIVAAHLAFPEASSLYYVAQAKKEEEVALPMIGYGMARGFGESATKTEADVVQDVTATAVKRSALFYGEFAGRTEGIEEVTSLLKSWRAVLKDDTVKVAAKLEIDGHRFYGWNGKWDNAFAGLSSEWGHAEIDALGKAFRSVNTSGRNAELWVTENLCSGACLGSNFGGNVPKAIRQMGLEQLTVHTPESTFILTQEGIVFYRTY